VGRIKRETPNDSAIVKVGMKGRWYSILVGGFAFWLPVVAAWAVLGNGPHFKMLFLTLNIAPLLALVAVALIDWTRKKRAVKWQWALAGIYIFGPITLFTASAVSDGKLPSLSDPLFWAMVFFPPTTLLLSFYTFTPLSLFVATVGLALLAILEGDRNKTFIDPQ
jgi:hypothetical protein